MQPIETLQRQAGLISAGCQAGRGALVTTSCLLHDGTGYFFVDDESGIPAPDLSYYMKVGLCLNKPPVFDELAVIARRGCFRWQQTIVRSMLEESHTLESRNRWKPLFAIRRSGKPVKLRCEKM